jgi:hypothetical protein
MDLRIEQDGSETTHLSGDGCFVIAQVPMRISGRAPDEQLNVGYAIGSFVGRVARLPLQAGPYATLTSRIPKELFRPRERLDVWVSAAGGGNNNVLWTKRYEVSWLGGTPQLEPMVDHLRERAE